uniref:Uncharacterized protein n=1 Tax=Lactuca sativa TaxID=4236 RepID=A0A9R1UP83_LACSA|nr:hypothetical protein LSAT_V11C800452340 [Lactuca sativa]
MFFITTTLEIMWFVELSFNKKKPWRNIERHFVPSSASNNLDIHLLPHTCTILVSSLCGLLLVESYDPNEYVSKFEMDTFSDLLIHYGKVCFGSYRFESVTFQGHSIVIHKVIVRVYIDMLTGKVDYDYYNIELFSSTTWQ